MLILKLAYRNLIGAGLRTWLKVAVLSITYVLIIWHYGFFTGMLKQGTRAMIKDEIAGGQYWHKNYDPYDPISLDESHSVIPSELEALIKNKQATPILIRQSSIYPEGRVQSVLLKGIEPEQKVLEIPTSQLNVDENVLPILIGRRMANRNSLEVGDYLTIRWRDVNGTFDAIDGKIVAIMSTQVPNIDFRQLWVPVKDLQKMTGLENEATIIIVGQNLFNLPDVANWDFKDHDFLLKDINEMVKSKRVSASIMYLTLLFLSILAIFDTQILSIFRRRKEIGILMALGMTRLEIILLFTFEGALNGVLAIGVAAIYGVPLIYFTATKGFPLPEITEQYGFAIARRLFPSYTFGVVSVTILIIMLTVTIVSYIPTRRIAKLKPTEALKGKIS